MNGIILHLGGGAGGGGDYLRQVCEVHSHDYEPILFIFIAL